MTALIQFTIDNLIKAINFQLFDLTFEYRIPNIFKHLIVICFLII